MDKENGFLVKICNCYINALPLEADEGLDLKRLFHLAKAHNLLGVCYCALAGSEAWADLPEGFRSMLLESFYDLVYIHEEQERCFEALRDVLSSSQTPYIAFKGIELRKLFPNPEARSMSDIDIVIRQEDRDGVKAALTKAGFDCVRQNGPVYNYVRKGVMTEVHTKLISDYDVGEFCVPFEHAADGRLDDSYHLAYLIAHAAHHFRFYGAGIKLVLDMAVLQQKGEVDIDRVMAYLADAGLESFGRVILTVCYRWFGIGRDYGADTAQTEEYLCRNGAFGRENEHTGAVLARRELEKGGSTSPLLMKLKLAFPPYSKLKNIDYIRFIDGRPWLVPYAWAYRFAYNYKNKKEFMKRAVNQLGDENTAAQAEKELEFFKEIGLV